MEEMKKAAALKALELVQPGMKLGLGTGSTARHLVDGLGVRVAAGLDVICVPTSEATRLQAESLSIPLGELGDLKTLDLTIDGADEIDPSLRLIKGGGAALLREKIVAAASTRMVVIADDSKCVDPLGAFPLPVEVNPFAHAATADAILDVISNTGHRADVVLRMTGAEPLVTDGGHYIYDCKLGEIHNPEALAVALNQIPGVVEHGLFIGLVDLAFIAGADGVRQMGDIEQSFF